MTAKEFLQQAFRLDDRINSKFDQLAALNALATKCTTTLTGMPRNSSPSQSQMADTVSKIVDLETELKADIGELLDVKAKIMTAIKSIPNPDHQVLLEQRYLYFKKWEQIAVDLNFSIQHTHRIHDLALREISRFLQSGE